VNKDFKEVQNISGDISYFVEKLSDQLFVSSYIFYHIRNANHERKILKFFL